MNRGLMGLMNRERLQGAGSQEPTQGSSIESSSEEPPREPLDAAFRTIGRATELIGILQQLESPTRRSLRVGFKAKGRIFLMDLAELVAVQAQGDYVSLEDGRNQCLLRGSLSSIAETLKPYGFIRIHRSVVVNISLVEEIEPLSTGEYKLRVKGGKQYMVTRTYKENLRLLAHLWLGPNVFSADRGHI